MSEERSLALHRLALRKLREDPVRGKLEVLAVLDRWSSLPYLARQRSHLDAWRRLLELPVETLESEILREEAQPLRQSSPLGVLVEPGERFAVFRELARGREA